MIEEQVRHEVAIGRRSLPFHGSVPPVLQPQPLMILPPTQTMFRYTAPPPLVREEIDFDSPSLGHLLQEEEESPKAVRIKKRKAAEADNTAGSEGKFLRPRVVRNKEWGCALCMVSMTNEEGLKNYLKEKKHQRKVAAELEGKTKAKKMVMDDESKSERKGKKKTVRIVIDGRLYWVVERRNHLFCEAYDVKCYNKEVMISHLSGKKHQQQQ